MPINTLINAVMHWASRTFSTGADWDENAPSSSQYIKNRPFYSVAKISEEVVYPVTTISPLEYDRSDQCLTWWDDSVSPVYEVGKTYVVTFNGVEYTCVCEEHDDGRRIIGNPTILHFKDGNYDGGIPFVVLEIDGGFYGGVYDEGYYNGEYGAEEMSCSVGVRKVAVVEDIKSLDAKYLPSDIYATVVTLTEAEDGTVTADMTVDEVAELVGSGRRVVAVTPFYNRVTIDQATKTTSNRNMVLGTLLNGDVATRVTGAVLVSGDKWTASETDVNTADTTYVGDFNIQVDASNGAIKTSGPHSDGTSRSRTMALATDLTSLATRVDALEGAGGGGAGPLIVGLNGGALDTPFADVLAALQAGQAVELRGDILTGLTDVLHVVAFGSGSITFSGLFIGADDSSVDVIFVVLNKDESVAAMPYTIAANPLT